MNSRSEFQVNKIFRNLVEEHQLSKLTSDSCPSSPMDSTSTLRLEGDWKSQNFLVCEFIHTRVCYVHVCLHVVGIKIFGKQVSLVRSEIIHGLLTSSRSRDVSGPIPPSTSDRIESGISWGSSSSRASRKLASSAISASAWKIHTVRIVLILMHVYPKVDQIFPRARQILHPWAQG